MHVAVAQAPQAVGQIFNCCGPRPTSGHEFAAILNRHFPGIVVQTGFPWSVAQGGKIEFDMSKAKRLLAFQPQYTLEDSILAIKDWVAAGGLEHETGQPDERFGGGVTADDGKP
jgi:nucleoside-diphosphate-sugar epimerase